MEYAPLNLWPRSDSQGEYYQTTIGPYDYYAINYGYATIPGTSSPEDECRRSNAGAKHGRTRPIATARTKTCNDGRGRGPIRASNRAISRTTRSRGAETQIDMQRGVMRSLSAMEPHAGEAFEIATDAAAYPMRTMLTCASMPSHWIGGQYLSRAHRGDPQAAAPIVPVPYTEEKRAFDMLDRDLFADNAWSFPASVLGKLAYSEWAGYSYTSWPGPVNLRFGPINRSNVIITRLRRQSVSSKTKRSIFFSHRSYYSDSTKIQRFPRSGP